MKWTYNKIKKSFLDVEAEVGGSCLILVPLHGIEKQDMAKKSLKIRHEAGLEI